MSASLVGSEMCIRDSTRRGYVLVPLGLLPKVRGFAVSADQGAFATHRAIAFRLGTVSYTHLTLPTICSV
eukprot:5236753-Alexandrium_andersonii.AAC.1